MPRKKPAPKKRPRKRTRSEHTPPPPPTPPDWAGPFLAELSERGCIRDSCLAAGIGRTAVYERRKADPDFARATALALEEASDRLEREAWRRAVEGVDRPVFGSGGTGMGTVEVGTIREYSDSLMALLLRAHRPAKYRERATVEHTGGVAIQHTLDLSKLSDEQLTQLEAITLAAGAPDG